MEYDLNIIDHPGKVNCVADALSRKKNNSFTDMQVREMESLELEVIESTENVLAASKKKPRTYYWND